MSEIQHSSRDDGKIVSLASERQRRFSPANRPEADSEMRIILVEWRIKPGSEQEFLNYWSNREVVNERSGLIGEFLNRVETRDQFPWITWELDDRWTTFVNVGLWRDSEAFQSQIGCKLDDTRPKLPFEAEKRRRIFLGPERWRVGGTALPAWDHALVS